MKFDNDFEIMNIADEYVIIPKGDIMDTNNWIISINEPTAFILKSIQENEETSIQRLIELLMDEYEVDCNLAKKDVYEMVDAFQKLGIIKH